MVAENFKLDASNSLPEIAVLLGHYFGDGSIQRNQFRYTNSQDAPLNHVIGLVKSIFGDVKFSKSTNRNGVTILAFSSIVGKVLKNHGAVMGNKIYQNFDVPVWILSGTPKIKSGFLQALFGDEGSVVVKNKVVQLKLCKSLDNINSLKNFLNSLNKLLSDFGISSKIVYTPYKERKVEGVLKIYGYYNLKLFSERIGFLLSIKDEKLKKTLLTYKSIISEHNKLTEIIRHELASGARNKDIAIKYGKRTSTISYHMNKIKKAA